MNLILDTVQQLNDYNDFDIYNVMESFDVPKLSTWQDQYDYLIETIDTPYNGDFGIYWL